MRTNLLSAALSALMTAGFGASRVDWAPTGGVARMPSRTVQYVGPGGYLNHGDSPRQSQRKALKAKNRAKHRRACRS